ncbi:MAG: hypothetical protein E7043_07690 [Lentisphaerae bacterium]|nr:hypothetical protein [Lentisphaerota bacterium]
MAEQDNISVTPSALDEDTRTRKTVRLRTIVPGATGPKLDEAPKTAVPAAESADAADTNTRVTVKLKPVVPVAVKPVVPAAVKPVIPAAESADAADTNTRVTVKLKPVAAAPVVTPATVPAENKAEAVEDTATRRNPVISAAPAAEEDDRTVKIQRPVLKKPLSVPAAAVKPAAEAPKADVPAAEAPKADVSAAEAPKAVIPPKMAVPQKPVVPKKPVVPPRPATPPASMPAAPLNESGKGVNDAVPAMIPGADKPSKLYTILAWVSLIFLLASATLITCHYLAFEHNVEIELPGIPFGK